MFDRFTDRDLATIATATSTSVESLTEQLRLRPWTASDLLASDDVFEAVIDRQAHPAELVSPFLLFSVLVHRAAAELRDASFVNEWAGMKVRLPVFDIAGVHDFLTDPARLMFLSRLLTAFTRPTPLPVPVDDRFDLVSIAHWLDAVPETDKVVLFERLGDLALFLSGVFPDKTGSTWISPIDAERLGKTVDLDSEAILGLCDSLGLGGLDAYETLGSEWYRAVSSSRPAPMIADVSYRFRAARRVLNHVADRFLFDIEPGFGFAA